MKTAISVKDTLFERADKFAKRKKMSRSQLFSEAVEEYMDKHEDLDEESLIARIKPFVPKWIHPSIRCCVNIHIEKLWSRNGNYENSNIRTG